MNPVEQGRQIELAVQRLVRSWVKFKYGETVCKVDVAVGPGWDDALLGVMHRVETVTLAGKRRSGQICIEATELSSFSACVDAVKAATRATLLPPVVVATKSGEWVTVINQGNGMLQGYDGIDNEFVYVDRWTWRSGVAICDVHLKYPGWCFPCPFPFVGAGKPRRARTTQLFRKGTDLNLQVEQSVLDAALLEQDDTGDLLS